ncbi:hypothetical protein TanjilG_10905 [Lupinus angustifolius]|uniref:digalactosyldiacylglycerol synthase 1, chloroplastic-like n=1 Tax=Lupinus angustifolius TaxID=3871 RepID=UPI00090D10B5|nr:PREDICTED: digalactosyldiacylglycerol synthase 1, chloroplastic-like [Lupinus angustifolius]OIV90419.1 hypothetical protein TanjilG_10905 [Lupinus angustifolius]
MSTHPTNSNAFSFITMGWRKVRDSADSDLRLMRDRANSFKKLATSIDRDFENFLNYPPPPFSVIPYASSRPPPLPAEIDFVKNLKPRLTGERRGGFSKKVLKKWRRSRSRVRVDLSAIRDAIVSKVEEVDGIVDFDRGGSRRRLNFRDFWGDWNGDEEEQHLKDCKPIRVLKTRLKEFDKKSEFIEKVKSSLKSMCKEPQKSKEVPPLDVPELLAYFIRQSGPFLYQLGVRRDICDKIVESLYSKSKNQLLLQSLSGEESPILGKGNINEELDLRIASVLQSTGHRYDGALWKNHAKRDLSGNERHFAIVTTASLPWMTGTAINPLFRAAYLSQSEKQKVTLLIPWLCTSDQELVYPINLSFSSPEEQELYIRNWLEERIGFRADFKISFYPGKFSKERRSIIPAGDTSQFIPFKDADIAILEEPEHLNWYHHGKRWTDKFNHVVGIIHTNYLEYIKREKHGALQAFLVKHINNWVTRAYCHKVLRLSAATQNTPKSVICNVHGVNPKLLKIGKKVALDRELGQETFTKGAYFLGKMVWAKGYKELIHLLAEHKSDLEGFNLDVFGSGEDANEVQSMAKRLDLNLNFQKGRDHADDSLHGYKVFINPSLSDVLCTATAEALAMGKFVVCADHPSNEFFRSFPNCLTYKTSNEFVAKVKEALENEPHLLTPAQSYQLSWEAATQRFMEYSELDKIMNKEKDAAKSSTDNVKLIDKSVSMPNLTELVDGGLAFAHFCLTGNNFLRVCTGAIPGTRDYDLQHSKDLNLLPPLVENPIYGW